MIEGFQTCDYVLCGLAIVLGLLGIFRGFSGMLAFLLATVAAFATASFGWAYSASLTSVLWMRGGGVLAGVLIVFGLVRMIVRKLVNGLLAQPTDAIFGCLVGLAFCVLLVAAWAYSGLYTEFSTLATEFVPYVR